MPQNQQFRRPAADQAREPHNHLQNGNTQMARWESTSVSLKRTLLRTLSPYTKTLHCSHGQASQPIHKGKSLPFYSNITKTQLK